MNRGDRIAIISESRPEWLFADLAILSAGAVTTPLYPTLATNQVGAMLRDSGASIVIVSSPALLDRVLSIAHDLPDLRALVVIDPPEALPASPLTIVSLSDVSARGHRRILDGWGVGQGVSRRRQEGGAGRSRDAHLHVGYDRRAQGRVLTHGNLVANLDGVSTRCSTSPTTISLCRFCRSATPSSASSPTCTSYTASRSSSRSRSTRSIAICGSSVRRS